MCARFTLRATPDKVATLFDLSEVPEMPPRFNIAPTQSVAAVSLGRDGVRRLKWLRWGLVPSWAKDPSMGTKLINARAESLSDRPAFRNAFARRRCLIPADGFYEWAEKIEECEAVAPAPDAQATLFGDLPPAGPAGRVKKPKVRKQPYYIGLADFSIFAFAGIYEFWKDPSGESLETCSIITTEPNELVRPLHDRMPAILHPSDYSEWLDRSIEQPDALLPLLRPFPAEEMAAYEVDTVVNSVLNETPECVAPLERS